VGYGRWGELQLGCLFVLDRVRFFSVVAWFELA
jgi:hypothetical protein